MVSVVIQVLLYEPHNEKRSEFVYIPSYVAFHSEQGVTEAVSSPFVVYTGTMSLTGCFHSTEGGTVALFSSTATRGMYV